MLMNVDERPLTLRKMIVIDHGELLLYIWKMRTARIVTNINLILICR